MAQTQTLKIPVEAELKVVGSSIASLKQALSGIAKDSGLYSGIESEISRLEKRFSALSTAAAKPFSSQSEISNFQKNVEKLSEGIQNVNKQFQGAGFKDLDFANGLTAEGKRLKAEYDNYAQTLKAIQEKVQNFKTDTFRAKFGANLDQSSAAADLKNQIDFINSLTKSTNRQIQIGINGDSFESMLEKIQSAYFAAIDKMNAAKVKMDLSTATRDALNARVAEVDSMRGIIKRASEGKATGQDALYVQGLFANAGLNNANEAAKKEFLMNNYGFDDKLLNQFYSDLQTNFTNISDEVKHVYQEALARTSGFSKYSTGIGNAATNARRTASVDEAAYRQMESNQKRVEGAYNTMQTENADMQNSEQLKGMAAAAEEASTKVQEYSRAVVEHSTSIRTAEAAAESASGAFKNMSGATTQAAASLAELTRQQASLDQFKSRLAMFFGFNRALNLVRNSVKNAFNQIKALDSVMTEIAVVTNMTQEDLWGQIGQYSAIAQQYAVATEGVYRVSQIYYQAGLSTNEVNALTTETLKMAKIANIDYADSADYMMTALRGFNMEMEQAQTITDVYSNLAAHTTSTTEELAQAMSKTASGAASVGSSFESTSAMLATMISVTRESANNIGSALKSIISRYGEMTKNPEQLVDSEGEEMSLNKVDAALQSIGISLHDATGQFRDFDDVILELAEKWDTIDSLSQRYIATTMAK